MTLLDRLSPRRRLQPRTAVESTRLVKLPISVLVQTKNEAVGIRACLSALDAFDEVIVVDSNSQDDTANIAASMGFPTINFVWDGRYPKKKQWQLDNVPTRNKWVLFLDADETPEPELVQFLAKQQLHLKSTVAAYDVRLAYYFSGQRLRHGHVVVKRTLLDRTKAQFPVVDDLDIPGMGELEGHYQPAINGLVETAAGRLRHKDLDPVRTWFERHNRYSDWEAELRLKARARGVVASSRTPKGQMFDKVPFKPFMFFVYSYVARRGYLDGRAGFDYAIALSSYYWQTGLKVREKSREQGRP